MKHNHYPEIVFVAQLSKKNEGSVVAIFRCTRCMKPYHPGKCHQNNYLGTCARERTYFRKKKKSPEGKHSTGEIEAGTEMRKKMPKN